MCKCFENYSHHSNTGSPFVLLLCLETKAFLRLQNLFIWRKKTSLIKGCHKWPSNLLAFQQPAMLCGSWCQLSYNLLQCVYLSFGGTICILY